jgi:hypothetical protein
MENVIDSHIEEKIEFFCREAYKQGWKDAKGRRRKKTEFNSCINTKSTEVLAW